MNIENIKLKNELNTLFINSPGSSAATVQIWFRAGSALEKEDHEGIAHFLEHMFFKGTPKRPGKLLTHEIESLGAEVNAFTSFDYTCYYINTPSLFIDKSLDLLLDMVANPLFSEEDIPAERNVVHEEYRRAMDNPSQFNFMQIQKGSFSGGYHHPILGREETILNFSREQITSFRQKFYNLENALLVVAGDLKNKPELIDQISSFKLPHGEKSSFEEFTLQSKSQVNVHEKEIKQATLTFCLQSPEYSNSQTAAEDLALNCLAHGETSRLYQALVTNTSLCNGVGGSTMYFAQGGVHMMKMNFPIENLDKAKALFIKTFQQTINQHFSTEELTKIKNQYIASKIYERESIESYAFSLGHGFAQTGNIFCEDEFIQRIKDVTVQDVMMALVRIFERPIHLTLQIPQGKMNTKLESQLKDWTSKIHGVVKKTKLKFKETGIVTSEFDPAVKVKTLKEGIKLIYRQNKMTPTFVFHAYIKGGQYGETKLNAGSYHLLSRLMTSGYDGINHLDLKNELESMSASLNGFSGKNAYGLTLHGQTRDKDRLLNHFFGTLKNPTLGKKFFDHERKIILRSLENQKEDPMKQAFKAYYQHVFQGHHYSLDLAGNNQTLNKMSPASLKRLHQQQLKKSSLVFTYCGDLDQAEVEGIINKWISDLPSRKDQKTKIFKVKKAKLKKLHLPFHREQTQIIIGGQAYRIGTNEELYLKMITAHLNGQSSDLFVEVRDRLGLCYSVAPVHVSALEAGCFAIYIGSGHDKSEKAIEAIMKILDNLGEHGITEDEFIRIKKMIDGQNLLAIQTNDDYAQLYSIPVLHQLSLDFNHLNHQFIRQADYQEFQKFLKKFFQQKWSIIQAGR